MLQPCIETIEFSDGYRAAVRWWRPPEPRGAILYFHGIQSHGGWYEASGARLAEMGFTVLMPDRRGSGLNRDQRGHSPSLDRPLDDAKECLSAVTTASGHPAAHLVGISWGGKLCVALAIESPERIASMSLVGPGLFPNVDASATEKIRVALSIVNDRYRSYDIPLNVSELFAANPERIRYVNDDKLKLEQVTAGFLLISRRLDRYTPRLITSAYRGPVHLLLAGRDRIIHNDRTSGWLRDLPSPDRQITMYPEGHHTLEFEPDPSAYIEYLVNWNDQRPAPPAGND